MTNCQILFNGSSSVQAIGVADECGHAIQDDQAMLPAVSGAFVPVAKYRTKAAIPIIFWDCFWKLLYADPDWSSVPLACGTLFQLVTLPVEFKASARLWITGKYNMLSAEELGIQRRCVGSSHDLCSSAAASILSLLDWRSVRSRP